MLHIGRKLLSRLLLELHEAGYLVRDDVQGRDHLHRFKTYNYIVADTIGIAAQSADNRQQAPLSPSPQRPIPRRPKLHLIISKEEINNSNYKTNSIQPDRSDNVEEPKATETRSTPAMGGARSPRACTRSMNIQSPFSNGLHSKELIGFQRSISLSRMDKRNGSSG